MLQPGKKMVKPVGVDFELGTDMRNGAQRMHELHRSAAIQFLGRKCGLAGVCGIAREHQPVSELQALYISVTVRYICRHVV